jgi:hypothetical protein
MGGGGWHSPAGNYVARLRAKRQVLEAVEADLRERGLAVPPRPASPERIVAIWLFCLLLFGLLTGFLFWR